MPASNWRRASAKRLIDDLIIPQSCPSTEVPDPMRRPLQGRSISEDLRNKCQYPVFDPTEADIQKKRQEMGGWDVRCH